MKECSGIKKMREQLKREKKRVTGAWEKTTKQTKKRQSNAHMCTQTRAHTKTVKKET
jgi:hypothetical protein